MVSVSIDWIEIGLLPIMDDHLSISQLRGNGISNVVRHEDDDMLGCLTAICLVDHVAGLVTQEG